MKVLWFEVMTPSRYRNENAVLGGWQDSLEELISESCEIELFVAFEENKRSVDKEIDGVKYIPIQPYKSFITKIKEFFSWKARANSLLPHLLRTIEKVNPDIIHVFGTEWPFGLVSKYTDKPVIIHIQGIITACNNASYPPGYSRFTQWYFNFNIFRILLHPIRQRTQESMEREIWKTCSNYMGRTKWDYTLSNILHPNCRYYHVNEVLRPAFYEVAGGWKRKKDRMLRLISTGCGSFWKGPDMVIKVAKVLMAMNIEFEWLLAGEMPFFLRDMVERHENTKFEKCHVKIMGFMDSLTLINYLMNSSLYIHTAYIENSPNSICEAQMIGIPVVSTNVGGISSIISDGKTGVLVPANDPWRMAYEIVSLWKDSDKMTKISNAEVMTARSRHDKTNILNSVIEAYKALLPSE